MTYGMPYVGCLVGSAFQKLTSDLEKTLRDLGVGITASEYMILRALYAGDGLQQRELCEMIGKDKASISRGISTLVGKGLVERRQISHKCCMVWLTPEGEKMRRTVLDVADLRHRALMDMTTQEDLNIFVKVLKLIVNE